MLSQIVYESAGAQVRRTLSGGPPPPTESGSDDGERGPGDDRARLLLIMHNADGLREVNLGYLWWWTDFSRDRLWRGFEDLEDVGYIERVEDPRSPPRRALDARKSASDRIFASTFVCLTEAGRHSPELADVLDSLQTKDQDCRTRVESPVRDNLCRLPYELRVLPARAAVKVAGEWHVARNHENPDRRSLSRVRLGVCSLGALCSASMVAHALVTAG